MAEFWLCFVPLFIAVDAIGVLPMYMALTEGCEPARLRQVEIGSFFTALAVATVFIAGGKMILNFVGIEIADFMVAGGILLFILALSDLLSFDKKQRRVDSEHLGAVPIGVPLIVGPAVLATALLLVDQYGMVVTLAATVVNIAIAVAVFRSSHLVYRLLGSTGSKVISKLASLLLAAIAVMMVRKGLTVFLNPGG